MRNFIRLFGIIALASIPAYCHGTWTDQITEALSGGYYSLKYIVTKNSITMLDDDEPPQDFTVIDVSPNNNDGPWEFIIRGKFYGYMDSVDYTGKFYISKTFDGELTGVNGIGDVTLFQFIMGTDTSDFLIIFPELTEEEILEYFGIPDMKLSDAIGTLSGIRAFVTPFGSNTNVSFVEVDHEGYSPLFNGPSALADVQVAVKMVALPGFTLALK